MKNHFTKISLPFLFIFSCILFLTNCKNDDDAESRTLMDFVSTNTGALAGEYLSDSQFKSLEVEIAYERNAEPTQAALDSLQTFLQRILKKPNGITFKKTVVPDQNKIEFSIEEIQQIGNNFRTVENAGDKITAFFFFADGSFDQDTLNTFTLGVAFNSSSMAVFESTIKANSGGIGRPARNLVEEGVVKHEFGHILGLVNLGTDPQSPHEDEEHPKHCNVTDCLMYFALETNQFIGMMGSGVPKLDAQCLADLKANGGK